LERDVPSRYFLSAHKKARIDELLPDGLDNNDPKCIYVPEGTKAGYSAAGIGDAVNLSYLASKTKRGRVGRGIAHTLTAQSMSLYTPEPTDGGRLTLRRLTPKECERLQGFPDDWTKYGKGGKAISDTQRYKMCGNAVTVSVIQAVFERLFARLTAPNTEEQDYCKCAPNVRLRDKADRPFSACLYCNGKEGAS
jgi:DNA (cytosine-5)-methyltransferase 1